MEKITARLDLVPEAQQKALCRSLSQAIRKAFDDPAVKKEYETWKKVREAVKA